MERSSIIVFYNPINQFPMAYGILPCPYPDAQFWLWCAYVLLPPHDRRDLMDEVMHLWKNSPYTHWFEDAEIVRHNGYILSTWSPATIPYLDNILFVGDSVWTGEAECTGAMMCGYKAAHAITVAFRENKLNREGVENYITWWRKHYYDYHDYIDFIKLFAMFEVMEAEDVNYLFGLLSEEALEPTLNPYRTGKVMNSVLMQKISQIKDENPHFFEKLRKLETDPIEKIYEQSIRRSFPNI